MGILINSSKNNQTLFDLLASRKAKSAPVSRNAGRGKRDIAIISGEGQKAISMEKAVSGTTHNRRIDESIDLQSYIDMARTSNQDAIANAGNTIDAKAVSYTHTGAAFRDALTEKYSKLAAEAKTHSDPEGYIREKYFGVGSQYYETDLNQTERQIAYNNEMQMYRTGKINGVSYQDSLFRGIEVMGAAVDRDRIQFERQVINSQISNILQQSGINTDTISENCTFTVDPYTYEISVNGVEDYMKAAMETAMNVGDNGKNLYHHIYKCSTQDGCNSTQVSSMSYKKQQAYQQVYTFTGLKINQMAEKNGTYYTEDGRNVLDIVDSAIDGSKDVPADYKAQMKSWIHELVSLISGIGWNDIADMQLNILLTPSGLKDMYQSINFQYDAENMGYNDRQWYQVM